MTYSTIDLSNEPTSNNPHQVGFWHAGRVGVFRKPSGIMYPKQYAENSDMSAATPEQKKKMYLFNCAQRAHGNFLENAPSFIPALLVAGLRYPVASSIMGVGWILSRIAYAIGYTRADRDDGKGRLVGAPFWLFQIGLYGMVGWSGFKMLSA